MTARARHCPGSFFGKDEKYVNVQLNDCSKKLILLPAKKASKGFRCHCSAACTSVQSHFDAEQTPTGKTCANLSVSEPPSGEYMNNVFDEKMTDIIIGEMVTQLLNEDAAISWRLLLERLQQLLDTESDEVRIRAALRAIEEIRAEMISRPAESQTTELGDLSIHHLH
ncbi:hypothetical protein RBJ15_16750 [Pantoea sp. BS_4]|uniref:hypothetical protein n=1 Tax=unclassified Pantoea TaxID=2630326 RepID=UPI0035C240CC